MSKDDSIGFKLALVSFVITVFLLITILFLGSTLNVDREDDLNQRFERMYQDFSSMQALSLIPETYDSSMACLAFEEKLKEMDSYIWKLGNDIDLYRAATEEFKKDKYYLKQKKVFNENELNYYLLLRTMVVKCSLNKTTILYFYKNAEDCKKCDDQSFILRDLSMLDDKHNKELAVFSFDMDLNISTLSILSKYYKTADYPCIVLNDTVHCGIKDRDFIMTEICKNKDISLCDVYFNK